MWYHLQVAIHVQTHKINNVTSVLIYIYSGLIFEQIFDHFFPTVKYAAHNMTLKKNIIQQISPRRAKAV